MRSRLDSPIVQERIGRDDAGSVLPIRPHHHRAIYDPFVLRRPCLVSGWLARVVLVTLLAAGLVVVVPASVPPASAEGPAPCSAGMPPSPYRGFCATYNGANTWFGSYGLGFPTPLGWALCAFRAGGGGSYPSPSYSYVLTGAPGGASTSMTGPLGFAFSEADAMGFWGGRPGSFSADQAAVAAKLLYDALVWGVPSPSMDDGVRAAYIQLFTWTSAAAGAVGVPWITTSLVGGGTTLASKATATITVTFPGTDRPLTGASVLLGLSNATFDGTSGSSTLLVTTDAQGSATVPFTASSAGPSSVTINAIVRAGQLGLEFRRPTQHVLDAQYIVAAHAPTVVTRTDTFAVDAPAPSTGTISIAKTGDDTAYFPIDGAEFDIMNGSAVLDTLVTKTDGTAGPSGPLPVGTYVVHEAVAPPGYAPAPDQIVTVTADHNTVVAFTGPAGDFIIPATATLRKVNLLNGNPLAGALLHLRYDPVGDGIFNVDLGTCTTDDHGNCTPVGNDGTGLLPGRYEVIEDAPPPGYAPDPVGARHVELAPGQDATITFEDPPLVNQSFLKTVSGNVDPAMAILSGATFVISTPEGALVTSCTTDVDGRCTTPALLTAMDHYCWSETAVPPGLIGGAHGCFDAAGASPPIPIVVTNPGRWVQIKATKVDEASPSHTVPGGTFDLYRMDDGAGPSSPHGPLDARVIDGGTWVARADGDTHGTAHFAFQFPDFAYCVIEHHAPEGYVLDQTPRCTEVLDGVASSPPTTVRVLVPNREQFTDLFVAKRNASTPGQGVPGALYDLYVVGTPPPSTPVTPDIGAAVEPTLHWYASGTTDAQGHLGFSVPVGHAWCIRERISPDGYDLDPALRCTGTISAASEDPVRTVAVDERRSTVVINAYKFNTDRPGTGIPGATYALFVNGAMPDGFQGPLPPSGLVVPNAMSLFAIGTTDADGHLSFTVPTGSAWCLRELSAPSEYLVDPGLHCTAILTTSSTTPDLSIALPEVHRDLLADTGGPTPLGLGLGLTAVGLAALRLSRRRRI